MKAVLKTNGIEINKDQYLISSLTKACQLKNDRVKTHLPIGKGLLQIVINKVKQFFDNKGQPYLATLHQALISTAYFGLFRVGELTSGDHPVLARDVHIGANKNKILFILRTSKTHWKNSKPQLAKISSSADRKTAASTNQYCPFILLQEFLKVRGLYKSQNEPFFNFFRWFSRQAKAHERQFENCAQAGRL